MPQKSALPPVRPRPPAGFRGLVTLLALAALLTAPALAGRQIVVFRDTRALEVIGAHREGATYLLELPGGSRLRVPADRIAEVRPYGPVREEASGLPPWRAEAGPFAETIARAATRYRLDPELLVAVALTESDLDPYALSEKGAQGVMQLMPATAREMGVENAFDAVANIDAGARYLRRMLDRFDEDLDLALAAYNAGEGAVQRYGGIPPYRETQEYLRRIYRHIERLRAQGGA